MKTAVEWYSVQLARIGVTEELIGHLTKEAKEIEKEQMCECYNEGLYQDIHSDILLPFEQYYNETFKK